MWDMGNVGSGPLCVRVLSTKPMCGMGNVGSGPLRVRAFDETHVGRGKRRERSAVRACFRRNPCGAWETSGAVRCAYVLSTKPMWDMVFVRSPGVYAAQTDA